MLLLILGLFCSVSFFMIIFLIISNIFAITSINYFLISGYYLFFCLFLLLLGYILPINRIKSFMNKKDKKDQQIIYLVNKNNLNNLPIKIYFIQNNDKSFSILAHNNSLLVINNNFCQIDYLELEKYIQEKLISLHYKLDNKNYALKFVIATLNGFNFVINFIFQNLKRLLKVSGLVGRVNNFNIIWSMLSMLLSLFIVIVLSLFSPILIITYIFKYLLLLIDRFNLKRDNNLIKNVMKVLY